MPDIFLSYSTKDKVLADDLVNDLRKNGISVWYDADEILVGHDIVDKVYDGIRNSRYLAILLSPNSINSKWVKQELNYAKVLEIEENQVTILPLLYRDCKMPGPLRTKRYADFRTDYATGLAMVLRVLQHESFPRDLGEKRIQLEDLVERQKEEVMKFATNMLEMTEIDEHNLLISDDYNQHNIAKLENKIIKCLNVLDHLISIEDAKHLLLEYHVEAVNLASMISDYKREAQYLEYVVEYGGHILNNLVLKAVANANADQRARSIESFRKAIRLYVEPQRSNTDINDFSKALAKFVYHVTRHIRLEYVNFKPFRDLIIFRDKERLIERLEKTMNCLDEAFERERTINKRQPYSYLNYAYILNFIGLTKRGLKYLERAKELGVPDSAFDEACLNISDIKREIAEITQKMTSQAKPGGELQINCQIIQMPNFCLQFGVGPNSFEEITEEFAPDFYEEFIRDDEIFMCPRE